MSKIKIPESEIFDLTEAEGAKIISTDTSWRHGHKDTWVVPKDGKFYRFIVPVTPEDGWQLFGPVDATEVKPVEKQVTITEWVDAT